MTANRRRPEAYKLRVYMDAIKLAENTSDAEWVQNMIESDAQYVPRSVWIAYLEKCALAEAAKLVMDEAA